MLAQTHPPTEVLVVDDGSTDDSASIAETYGKPIRVIRQENQGESVARNRGMEEAEGDWIAFLDADDIWEPSKLQRQCKAVAGRDDVVASHTWFFWFGAKTGSPPIPERAGEAYSVENLLRHPFINTSTALVRNGLSVRFPDWTCAGEDMLFFCEVANVGAVVFDSQALVGYRMHSRQQTRSAQHVVRNFESRLEWITRNPLQLREAKSQELRDSVLAQMVQWMVNYKWTRCWDHYWSLRHYLEGLDWPPRRRPGELV